MSTAWPSFAGALTALGITFDPWQVGAARAMLARRASGVFAAAIGGIVLSIPRQVGKTFLVGSLLFALCLLRPGSLVLWTAHRTKTAGETFRAMQGMAKRKAIAPYIARVNRSHGEEAIEFTNGARILFGARESGFGRGFTVVHVVVFDEAQILSEKTVDDMVPATNSVEDALVFYIGTPPKPTDNSEVFTNRRNEALKGEFTDGLFIEFSADENAELMDREQWAKANPSFPTRTSETAILRMLKQLGSASFRREALGIWDASSLLLSAFDVAAWGDLTAPPPDDTNVAYGVKFSPDGARMALVVAASTEDGPYLEAIRAFTGSTAIGLAGLAEWLAARWRDCDGIVIDGKGGAGALNDLLLDLGVNHRKITRPTFDQVVTANTALVELVRNRGVRHSGQPGLAHSVATSTRKDSGQVGGWTLIPFGTDGNPVPIQAAALAVSVLGGRRGSNGKRRRAQGKAVF